jgi:hypothetical protein
MVTGSIDIQGIAVLAHTFGHAQIGDMGPVFLAAFKVKVNVRLQIFLLLRSRFHLHVALMGSGDDFLADFTMDLPAAGMSLQ